MLFEKRLRDGLLDGTISVAFRRWRRPQVVPGGRYRLGGSAGRVVVESIEAVEPSAISADDARRAGFAAPADVLNDVGPDKGQVYRVTFGAVEADPRDALRESDADLDALAKRVQRIDGAEATLRAIAAQPGVRAADLMGPLGWSELLPFKLHVRRLKALGLTISLRTGYQLSARGAAYLARQSALSDQPSAIS